jgi:hypothetical protein
MMRAELAIYRAPGTLLSAAERARHDEVRHARAIARIARRFGGKVSTPCVALRHSHRSLEEIALENVSEGCVRETFGVLVAMWQARTAGDPEIARIMNGIAHDETRHAALAWRLHRWVDRRLAERARRRVRIAMRQAVETLELELAHEPTIVLRDIGGLPAATQARAMLQMLDRELWRPIA